MISVYKYGQTIVAHDALDVFGAAMTLGNGSIAVAEHRRDGAADNIAATEYDRINAG